jgi:hypothetical protein
VCDIVEAAPAELGEVDIEDGVVAFSRIILKCKVLKDIS